MSLSSASRLEALLAEHCPEWDSRTREKIVRFREVLLAENEIQNLTRLTSEEDFFWGHAWDVAQLHKTGWLGASALDLGSGGGVPGLLSAVIQPRKWALVDSEKKKAAFLEQTAQTFALTEVQAYPERVEKVLPRLRVETVVARAVGPMLRMWVWIGNCSTWNNLILFKGPSWEQEWSEFRANHPRAKISVAKEHAYKAQSADGERTRKLILLQRP